MEVILLEKMRNLGALGDTVKVKAGYARNFLIPQSKAVYATKTNIAKFEQRRAELETAAAERLKQSIERQEKFNALPAITIAMKAGEEGKLFGSITIRDIVAAINKTGIEVEKREVRLPEGTLRNVGEYDIAIELDGDVSASVKFNIIGEG